MHTKIVNIRVWIKEFGLGTKIKIGIAGQLLYKYDASNDMTHSDLAGSEEGGGGGMGNWG